MQSAHQIRITDFGLAKLLDYNEEQFQATGGKVKITIDRKHSPQFCFHPAVI